MALVNQRCPRAKAPESVVDAGRVRRRCGRGGGRRRRVRQRGFVGNVRRRDDGRLHAAAQSSGPLTVWVDSTRVPAAQAYEKAHPSVKLNIVTYDGDANGSNTLQTKVDLYDRTGSGWPDVVFSAESNEVSWAQPAGFTAPLNKGLIPSSVLSNFSTGALAPCTVNGTVYCLRNDLAPVVLWYNATLMKQWGYQVPTTWPQYEQIGQEVAKQHPGYIVGAAGDTFTPEIYMWASQCQANDVTGIRAVTVNVTSPNCTRMASLLDTLLKDKSMSKPERVQQRLRQAGEGQGAHDARPRSGSAERFSTAPPA